MTNMADVPITDIIVGRRFREDYGDLGNFITSIEAVGGILQPITVLEGTPGSKGKYVLASGGRRLRAYTEMKRETIPCLIRPYTDELDLREVELIENLARKDMSWVEQNALIGRIHELQIQKHGAPTKGKPTTWTQSKTAELLDRSVGGVNRALAMNEAVKMFPELGKLDSEDKAVQKFRKVKEAAIVKTKVAEQKQIMVDAAAVAGDDGLGAYLNLCDQSFRIGDAFAELRYMVDNNLIPPTAFIEVDPPYGIDLQEKKKGDGNGALDRYEEVDAEHYPEWLDTLCGLLFRATPAHTRMVFWFGPTWQQVVYNTLIKNGWKLDPIPAIWTKGAGQTNSPDTYLARTYEPFFICWKPGDEVLPIRQRGRANVFHYPPVAASKKYHPTQRPIELIQEILRTFAWPGQIVMVPFLGSGATLLAAGREDMLSFGWELNEPNKPRFMVAAEADFKEATAPVAAPTSPSPPKSGSVPYAVTHLHNQGECDPETCPHCIEDMESEAQSL